MAVDEATTLGAMRNGVAAIEEEFEQHGTEDDKECLRSVAGADKKANELQGLAIPPLTPKQLGH
eukprot:6208568-Pleurochrysis_carterae.AAC.1